VNFAADWGLNDTRDNNGTWDAFITKINNDGSYGWTKIMGGNGDDCAASIAIDDNGDKLITGWFQNSVNFAADWSGNDNKSSNGSWDVFITKLDTNDNYKWTHKIGGNGVDFGYHIDFDSNGDMYIVGRVGTSVNFALDWGGTDNKDTGGVFITKINADGSYGWTKVVKNVGTSVLGHKEIYYKDGYIYLTGYFSDTVNFAEDFGGNVSKTSAGGSDVFIMKIKVK